MDAKELRIGNLFQDKYSKDIFEVLELSKLVIVFDYVNMENWQAEPIPITEEWLIKFGFIKDISDAHNVWYNLKYLFFDFRSDSSVEFKKVFIRLNKHDIVVDYVHQLQNLYFALTQTELKLNE